MTIAEKVSKLLGDNGLDYSRFGILTGVTKKQIGSLGEMVYLFEDGSVIVDLCCGWDIGYNCPKHGWTWESVPCYDCENNK